MQLAKQQPAEPIVVTPAMRKKAEDNIRKAKVQLVIHQPFFASIVLKRRLTLRDDVETCFIDQSGHITLGTAYISGLTVQQTMFELCHESMHYAMLHHIRRGWRKPRPANIAMDKVIDDLLINNGLTKPDPVKHFPGSANFAWEQLYDENEGGGGGGGTQYQPGTGRDDLSDGGEQMTPEQVEEIKQELLQAQQAAKSQGKMPANLKGLIEDIINPSTPWYELLERFMTQYVNSDLSWRRPNRKLMASIGTYMPSVGKAPAMGTVVIQIDESGSVSDRELQHFGGHMNKIIESCNPEKVIVLHTDSRVGKAEEFAVEELPIQFKTYCRGGTDMTAGFKWVEDHGVEPDVFVCLTDGETPFGEPPGYPVVWLVTGKMEAPHGETIQYEMEG